MKRVLLTVAVALLIPGLLGAAPATLGLYVDGKLHYSPVAGTPFDIYLYLVQSDYFVTGIEYQLVQPAGNLLMTGISYPANYSGVNVGDPFTGHAITYWPPMTAYPDGYDLMATFHCYVFVPCAGMPNYTLTIGPNPATGELRGTYSPDNELFPIIGLTTYLCPDGVANDNGSWGTIKSLYR